MATNIWTIAPENIIDYSPNGDDIDTFSIKVKRTLESTFEYLNALKEIGDTLTTQLQTTNVNAIRHLQRLVGELHLALAIAGLETTGYDSMLTEVFRGTTHMDTTSVPVTTLVNGSDYIGVETIEGLMVGGNYLLTDGTQTQAVKISALRVSNGNFYALLTEKVNVVFDAANTFLKRTTGTISEGYIQGDGVSFVTTPITFINQATGDGKNISSVHLNIKHQNIADAEITAEVALINKPIFIKGEVIAIGTGEVQRAGMFHTYNFSSLGFKLYFNGEEQTEGYVLSPSDATVTFTAPVGQVVTADYYFYWGEENFEEMEQTGVFCDQRNNSRATSQFVYQAESEKDSGSAAVIRLTLKAPSGTATEELVEVESGKYAAKLPPSVSSSNAADYIFSDPSAVLVSNVLGYDGCRYICATATPELDVLSVTYPYKQLFKIDSFAVMFDG